MSVHSLFRVLCAAFAAMCFVGCSSVPTGPSDVVVSMSGNPPVYAPKDSWAFYVTDYVKPTNSGVYTLEVDRMDGPNVILLSNFPNEESVLTYTQDGNPISDGKLTYEKPNVILQYPFNVGEKRKVRLSAASRLGRGNYFFNTTYKVVGFETVSTRAGQFQAVRIDYDTDYEREDNPGYHGMIYGSLWYAPKVKWFVKTTYRSTTSRGRPQDNWTMELTRYNVQ